MVSEGQNLSENMEKCIIFQNFVDKFFFLFLLHHCSLLPQPYFAIPYLALCFRSYAIYDSTKAYKRIYNKAIGTGQLNITITGIQNKFDVVV